MREYQLEQAQSYENASVLALARRIVVNLWKRRGLRKLRDLDDFLLHDIGLVRDEIDKALRLPLTVDPLRHLIDRSHSRGTRRG
jgi:uncharacterized protein YjiS (DUF1127 family)